jgi:hypothetical protein
VSTAASIVPGLIGFAVLVALWPLAVWIRRREWRAFSRRHWRAHPSIDQASHDRPDDLLEQGRRLASQRDDLIAQGVDPSELEMPLAPPPGPGQEDGGSIERHNQERGDK